MNFAYSDTLSEIIKNSFRPAGRLNRGKFIFYFSVAYNKIMKETMMPSPEELEKIQKENLTEEEIKKDKIREEAYEAGLSAVSNKQKTEQDTETEETKKGYAIINEVSKNGTHKDIEIYLKNDENEIKGTILGFNPDNLIFQTSGHYGQVQNIKFKDIRYAKRLTAGGRPENWGPM